MYADYHTIAAPHHYHTYHALSPSRKDIEWSWLIVVRIGAGWVALRRPWDNGGSHGRLMHVAAHFVGVLRAVLRGWMPSLSLQKIDYEYTCCTWAGGTFFPVVLLCQFFRR